MESDSIQNKLENLSSLYNLLQDQTRADIFLYLFAYQALTLKDLAKSINKSKATIFHHIRKLQEFLEVEEKEEGRRFKTKYYRIDWEKLKPDNPILRLESAKIETLLINDIIKKFLDGRKSLLVNESFTRIFMITEDTRPIFDEFEAKLLEAERQNEKKEEEGRNHTSLPHFHAIISVPLGEILKKDLERRWDNQNAKDSDH